MKSASKTEDFTEHYESGTVAFDGNFITVQQDTVRLSDGTTATRDVVRHPGAVAVMPLIDEQTILLEWQYRYPLAQHLWEIPAGKREKDEAPLATAKRELLEETGYQASDWREVMTFASAVGFCDEKLTLFLAKNLAYSGHNRDEGEFLQVEAVTLTAAWQMLAQGDITDAKTIIALLWLKNR